ncbi:von Willebrand factor d and egf domain-containing protein [Plakobranchus ocellatus]|uniref:von Willebrand factor d and egf domain-containing protein n=1 Tax=Plakobranchus ocellatus TaxID=259542 RepID=A0AAV3ZJF6_9GAST|nr:von Willebrand factor d and egf domain-containing protein [Plakobranchus ocellatus]
MNHQFQPPYFPTPPNTPPPPSPFPLSHPPPRPHLLSPFTGWDDWSPWSACTQACGGGRRSRSRDCPRREVNVSSACVGVGQEVQSCNVFSCQGSHDLLTLMGIRSLPYGVTKLPETDNAYLITADAKISLPASRVYDVTLPSRFSLVTEFKVHRRNKRRYFFVVSDYQGKQQLAIFLSRKLKFQYLGNNYGFKMDLLDNAYHSVAVSVDGERVTLIVDCETLMSRRLRSIDQYLGTNLVMSIGPYYSEYSKPFIGEVRQLVISENAAVAALQCGDLLLDPSRERNEGFDTTATPTALDTSTLPLPQVYGIEWSPWTPCSATCGQGRQSRQPYCRANVISGQSCDPSTPLRPQLRFCYMGICGDGAVCDPPCENGGQCLVPGQCMCQYGYSGLSCTYKCSFACHHGGECVGLNQCKCSKHYTGIDCSTPVCKRTCLNGGQCVSPNTCSCPFGFYGKRCQRVRCRPKCKNGGLCVSPDVCLCKSGYHGERCQKDKCRVQCLNGGTCEKNNKCKCLARFFGRRCQKERCTVVCMNGGRCKHSNHCRCPSGFSGRRCERRTCTYQRYLVPHRRTYRRIVREEQPIPCGNWSTTQTCVRTRLKYVLITRETYRPIYRCV